MATSWTDPAVLLYIGIGVLALITAILASLYLYIWFRHYRGAPGYMWKKRGNVVLVPDVSKIDEELASETSSQCGDRDPEDVMPGPSHQQELRVKM